MLGGDANGVTFRDFCWESWKSLYGTSPPWGNKEFAQLHEARQRIDTEQLAREAWSKFMASTDPFHEGHSPGKFLYSLSEMTARAVKAIPRERRDKMTEDAKTLALRRIYAEVNEDVSIPEAEKQNEASRRYREEFPT